MQPQQVVQVEDPRAVRRHQDRPAHEGPARQVEFFRGDLAAPDLVRLLDPGSRSSLAAGRRSSSVGNPFK
jgi:hypothetical protein